MYYRHAVASVIVYDVTKSVTFVNAAKWLIDLQENIVEGVPIVIALVGNKTDATTEREVSIQVWCRDII